MRDNSAKKKKVRKKKQSIKAKIGTKVVESYQKCGGL